MRLPKYSSIRTPATLAVSWLNFEPKVSKFPAVSANVADTAHATIGSFSFFIMKILECELKILLCFQKDCDIMSPLKRKGNEYGYK